MTVCGRFRADGSNSGRGFQLQYSTVCDTEVTGLSGVIESPNFPRPYPHNRSVEVSTFREIFTIFGEGPYKALLVAPFSIF